MMFAILFNSLLGGQLSFCNRISNETINYLNINKTKCLEDTSILGPNAIWTNYDVNYDNIINSMISLFILSTLEGWPE